MSIDAQIDRLERDRGQLLKRLCKIADQIKVIDVELKKLEARE